MSIDFRDEADAKHEFANFVELLSHRAKNQSKQKAYSFLKNGETEIESLTYQELQIKAQAIATSLQSLKVYGERALLLYQPGLDFIAAFLGCLYAGVIAVPAYPPRKNQNLSSKTIVVGWLPVFHDMGLIGNVLQPLYLGVPCVLMSPVDFLQKPMRWLQAISHYKATTSGGPNFAYDLCIRKATPEELENLDLSSWEVAFTGAEPIRAETLEKFTSTFASCGFHKQAFYPCYGMAETTLIVSGGEKTALPITCDLEPTALEQNRVVKVKDSTSDARTIVGCGQSPTEQKVVIVNPESLTLCLPNQIGEIWVAGASVAQGYWNNPEQTEKTFHAYLADTKEGPFLRTGDLGFLQDGELFITGRLKDVIIIRGQNHYPQDIELTVENSHPSLRLGCGAAFAIDFKGSERLVIVHEVERSYLRKLNVQEVVDTIRQAVVAQHGLQVFATSLIKPGSIPKTSSGKIRRHYGLDSSAAVGLTGDLEDWLETEIDPTLLYDYPTVEAIVKHLSLEINAKN
jgi:acyl-CoA synthetase (AMP-forming)/AMP-acid ligase II